MASRKRNGTILKTLIHRQGIANFFIIISAASDLKKISPASIKQTDSTPSFPYACNILFPAGDCEATNKKLSSASARIITSTVREQKLQYPSKIIIGFSKKKEIIALPQQHKDLPILQV